MINAHKFIYIFLCASLPFLCALCVNAPNAGLRPAWLSRKMESFVPQGP